MDNRQEEERGASPFRLGGEISRDQSANEGHHGEEERGFISARGSFSLGGGGKRLCKIDEATLTPTRMTRPTRDIANTRSLGRRENFYEHRVNGNSPRVSG